MAISLPLLDSMVPALTAQTEDRGECGAAPGLRLRAAWRGDGQMDAHRHRHGFRVSPDPERAANGIARDVIVLSNLAITWPRRWATAAPITRAPRPRG